MTDRARCALYLRQSLDVTGEGQAVSRQREACRNLAESRGWVVVAEYCDNDTSASGKVARPEFARLMAAIEAGEVDVALAWHVDRITRTMADLEMLVEVCERTGVKIATASGDIDLSTDAGRLVARILAAVARAEIERKSARQRLANDQRARAGEPAGGRRPFGYEADRMTIRSAEAEALRAAAEEVISGRGLWAATERMAAGHATAAGGVWHHTELRRTLLNPRYAGRRVHRGVDVGPARWPPVFDEDTAVALRAVLMDPSRRRSGAPAQYLLSSLARCGAPGCGLVIHGAPAAGGRYPVYSCASRRHVAVRVEYVDAYVVETLAARLGRPDGLAHFAPPDGRGEVARLRRREAALEARAAGLAEAFAAGDIDRAQLRAGTDRVRTDLGEVRVALGAAVSVPAFHRLLGADDVAGMVRGWARTDVRQFRAVLDVVAEVRLISPGRGARRFRPECVEIAWRE